MNLFHVLHSEMLIRRYNETRPAEFEGRAVGCFFSRMSADMLDEQALNEELATQNARTHGHIVFERVQRSGTYFYVSVILSLLVLLPVFWFWDSVPLYFPIKLGIVLVLYLGLPLWVETSLIKLKLLTRFQKWRAVNRAAKNGFFPPYAGGESSGRRCIDLSVGF